MTDYVSRQYLLDEYDRQHQGPPGGARKIIAEAPAAAVAPVVRCRGCSHFDFDLHFCFLIKGYMRYDDFCSYGDRKDEEKLTEQEKAELIQKEIRKEKEEAVIFFIAFSIFIFILCGVSIIID